MKIIYFDTETTGLDPKKNAIIQLAFIIEIDGKEVEVGDIKIAPREGDEIEDRALAIHGMSRETIATFKHPQKAYFEFTGVLGKYVSKFDVTDKFTPVAYNGRFDMDFLNSFFEKAGDKYFGSYFNWELVDPLAIMRHLRYLNYVNLKNYKLETVCEYFGIELNAHDALSDVRATKQVLEKVNKYLKNNSYRVYYNPSNG